MGAASSGGSDNQVSGAEAVATGGKTYSSRKTKTVNKEIADTNKKNRDDRRSPIAKIFSKTIVGSTLNKISNSKFVQDQNFKSRFRFARKSGKFKDTPLTREFVLSDGFKTQLDGMGYSDKNEQGNNTRDDDGSNRNQNGPPLATIMPIPTDAPNKSLDPVTSEEDKKYDERKTKKKGRRRTLLTSSRGVTTTSPDYSLGKPTLLGMV